MGFVFFDTETTGLERGFDQIVHFAAIRTDNDLNEIDRFEARCRLMPHVVPHPRAILTNGLPIARLTDRALPTHYQMVRVIQEKLLGWSPSIVVGFNSIFFDEEMLRHALFQTLHDPYLTSRHGNGRADALGLVMAASAAVPGCVVVPASAEGRPVFRLEALAAANEIEHGAAHDALSDVSATVELCRRIQKAAPEVWQRFVRFSNKASVDQFVGSEDGFVLTEFFGNEPFPAPVVCIGADPEQPGNGRLCLRLDIDVEALLALDDEALREALAARPGPVRRLRTNASPVLTPLHEATDAQLGGVEFDTLESRARDLRDDDAVRERLVAAWAAGRKPFDKAAHVEARTHDGIPGDPDQVRRADFHDVSWPEAVRIVEHFDDDRLRCFGLRLIYLGNRSVLPPALAQEAEQGLMNRLLDESSGGLTLAQAATELDAIENDLTSSKTEMLSEYRLWLASKSAKVSAFKTQNAGV